MDTVTAVPHPCVQHCTYVHDVNAWPDHTNAACISTAVKCNKATFYNVRASRAWLLLCLWCAKHDASQKHSDHQALLATPPKEPSLLCLSGCKIMAKDISVCCKYRPAATGTYYVRILDGLVLAKPSALIPGCPDPPGSIIIFITAAAC